MTRIMQSSPRIPPTTAWSKRFFDLRQCNQAINRKAETANSSVCAMRWRMNVKYSRGEASQIESAVTQATRSEANFLAS